MSEEPEPLWASSLDSEHRQRYEEVFPQPVDAEEDVPPDDAPPAAVQLLAVLTAAVVAAMAVTVVALAMGGRVSVTIEDVPSNWGDIAMRCDTARFEQDGRAFELFACRALDEGALPPGVYASPESVWNSDLTGIDAVATRIVITRDGELTGRAAY